MRKAAYARLLLLVQTTRPRLTPAMPSPVALSRMPIFLSFVGLTDDRVASFIFDRRPVVTPCRAAEARRLNWVSSRVPAARPE